MPDNSSRSTIEMHFRLRKNVVQLVRNTYSARTKKAVATVIARMPLTEPVLTDEIAGLLTANEIVETKDWIDTHCGASAPRGELVALEPAELPLPRPSIMNVNELVVQAKAAAGKKLADVPDAKAKALLRHVFAEILKSVEAAEGQPVRVPGLGVFRTTTVEREKDGSKVAIKRTHFRAAASAQKT